MNLPGLLNQRGAKDVVNKALARNVASPAMLLVDIDHLKMIVAMRGRSAADALVVCTAEAIRQSVHDGDICARLGEGEFMVFFADCDMDCGKETAERILDRLRQQKVPLSGVKPTVSIGIASHGADTDFSRMYRDADEALYQARLEGKSCIGVFAPSTPATSRERSDATPGSPATAPSNVTV